MNSQTDVGIELPKKRRLSPRMMEALFLISTGLSRKEIALDMGISINTLRNYLTEAYSRIGAKNAAEAASRISRPKGID